MEMSARGGKKMLLFHQMLHKDRKNGEFKKVDCRKRKERRKTNTDTETEREREGGREREREMRERA